MILTNLMHGKLDKLEESFQQKKKLKELIKMEKKLQKPYCADYA